MMISRPATQKNEFGFKECLLLWVFSRLVDEIFISFAEDKIMQRNFDGQTF